MSPDISRVLILGLVVGLGLACGVAWGRNLVYNGDFELPSSESPPPGWAMWGPEASKVPANYTRDASDPKQGAVCLRICHPAHTEGYLVSSPDHAIRAKRGMTYRVSFWARADKAARAQFGFTAYQSIDPYVGAPSPGWFTVEVGPQWQQFAFEVHEGWDFFAKRSRLLLLSFKATGRAREEGTLWVDDVQATEQPSPMQGRLVDETALKYEPLQHRLRPGPRLQFTVDAGKRLRRAPRDVGGIAPYLMGLGEPFDKEGRYTLAPQLEEALREMRLPMTRFYGLVEEPFGLEGAVDKAAELCGRIGVPSDHTVLELERVNAAEKLSAEVWARVVEQARQKGYGFRHWEVANEPYAALWGYSSAFPTADDYLRHFLEAAAAVRQADSTAHVGMAIHWNEMKWGNYLLKQAAGSYDFVVAHYYVFPRADQTSFEDIALSENYKVLGRALQINALIRSYNPGRDVYQYDTEWGLHSMGPNNERADYVDRNANIFGALHRAVRLIYYAREGMLAGACGWKMFSHASSGQGFGILSLAEPDKRFMLYWLYYYFNRHVGDWVLDIRGTAPYYAPHGRQYPASASGPVTPVLATLREDGRQLYLVIANGSWEAGVPCCVTFRRFIPADATAVVLSHDDPDAKPLLEHKEDAIAEFPVTVNGRRLTCTIPPHSVVFVTLSARPAD